MDELEIPRISRRLALKWVLTAAASTALMPLVSKGGSKTDRKNSPEGYGRDPDLQKDYKPGDFWPLTFTKEQRALAASLCDLIIPADENSPSASSVSVHDFIDEWISSPYVGSEEDKESILGGFKWLNAEAQKRFSKPFVSLDHDQKCAICDTICYLPKAAPDLRAQAEFFALYRDLTAGGYYTTPEGMKSVGYVGNRPSPTFEGPPPEALRRIGL